MQELCFLFLASGQFTTYDPAIGAAATHKQAPPLIQANAIIIISTF